MPKYPEDWDSSDIRYHETGEVLCPLCFRYCQEDNMIVDEYGSCCPGCAEDHTCHYCGEIHKTLLPYGGEQVCPECKEALIEEEN